MVSKASPYNPQSEKCDLCLTEKAMIATFKNKDILLNTRKEMMNKCRHRDKWLLSNWKNEINHRNLPKHASFATMKNYN